MTPALRCAAIAVSLVAFAATASAEVQPWDQAKVTELAQQLETRTNDLWETFRRQPRPTQGSGQSRSYFRLQQQIRQLRREARSLSRSLQQGATYDEALPSYESMMQTVRTAQDEARRVFSGADVQEKAAAAREVLNQLMPYFDANPTPVEPVTR